MVGRSIDRRWRFLYLFVGDVFHIMHDGWMHPATHPNARTALHTGKPCSRGGEQSHICTIHTQYYSTHPPHARTGKPIRRKYLTSRSRRTRAGSKLTLSRWGGAGLRRRRGRRSLA